MTLTGAAPSPSSQVRPLTELQVEELSPQAQAVYMAPLRADAAALGQVGRTSGSGIYGNVVLEPASRQVDLQLTDPRRAGVFIKAAQTVDHSIDTRLIHVVKARYSRKTLDVARDKLLQQSESSSLGYKINLVAVDPGSASITVGVANPVAATARARLSSPAAGSRGLATAPTVNGIPLTFVHSLGSHPDAWRDTKWHDSAPFIAGDVITDGQGTYCTAGLDAVTAGGADVIVTEGHCFPTSTNVYTGGGTVGTYDDAPGTTYMGYIYGNSQDWDAELINGAANNSDGSDTNGWLPVTSSAYSYDGDLVCQDGARSFYLGHPTPCDIKVTNQDVTITQTDWTGTHTVRGVEGFNTLWTSIEGDSGGLVFTITGSSRQARGMVSGTISGTDISNGGSYDMIWTEAPDILGHFGLHLNPTT